MIKKKDKLQGISWYYDSKERVRLNPEVRVREAFMRATREILDNYGIESYSSYSIEQLRGMVDLLEKYHEINRELEN